MGQIFCVFITYFLLFFSVSTALAVDNMWSAIQDSANNTDVEQCVKDLNLSADDSLDTAERIFQTGMCHFCITCELNTDNGQVFLNDADDSSLDQIVATDNYKIAHKLFSQSAELGNRKAYYGLAVLQYILDLRSNRKSKIDTNANISLEKSNASEDQIENDSQVSIDNLIAVVIQKAPKSNFSQQIHSNLLAAATLGYLPAQFALSEVYFKGIGINPDVVQAYAWAATAVSQNPPFGSQRRDEKAVDLDNVKLHEAEMLAEEYIKKYTDLYLIVIQ